MKGKKFHKVKEEESEGWLAQLVELLPYKQTVTGSSPVPPNLKNSGKNQTFFGAHRLRDQDGNLLSF